MHKNDYVCDCGVIHAEAVSAAVEKLPSGEIFSELISLYKLLGDATRCRILFLLRQRELCVCDIASALGVSKSLISHQLRLLREGRIVKSRREGKEIFYSLCDGHVEEVFDCGLSHVEEEA